jgi:SAM-dependent methyltransferase
VKTKNLIVCCIAAISKVCCYYEEAFTKAYEDPVYWQKEYVGTSGSGSTPKNVRPYQELLQRFLVTHDIHSVIDLGCGDWQFSRLINWSGIEYLGLDIVPKVIKANQEKYRRPNIHFFTANFIDIDLPKSDLLICKDVLQHLPVKDIKRFLKKTHKYKYCLITNDVDPVTLTSDNCDISAGYYRPIDLTVAPFCVKAKKILTYRSGDEIKQVLLIENSGKLND